MSLVALDDMADLDFTDQTDFGDVERGFVGTLDDPVITAADGHVVWDCSKYDFIPVMPRTRPIRACGARGSW